MGYRAITELDFGTWCEILEVSLKSCGYEDERRLENAFLPLHPVNQQLMNDMRQPLESLETDSYRAVSEQACREEQKTHNSGVPLPSPNHGGQFHANLHVGSFKTEKRLPPVSPWRLTACQTA